MKDQNKINLLFDKILQFRKTQIQLKFIFVQYKLIQTKYQNDNSLFILVLLMRCYLLLALFYFIVVLVAQLGPILRDPVDWNLPGSSGHGIFQARILEWVAISFSITIVY